MSKASLMMSASTLIVQLETTASRSSASLAASRATTTMICSIMNSRVKRVRLITTPVNFMRCGSRIRVELKSPTKIGSRQRGSKKISNMKPKKKSGSKNGRMK